MRSAGIFLGILCLCHQSAWAEDLVGELPPESKEQSFVEIARAHQRAKRGVSLLETNLEKGSPSENLFLSFVDGTEGHQIRILLDQLKTLYKPTTHWSAYAGILGDSTGTMGLSAGASADITAPLCRYIGLDANTAGYVDGGLDLAYNARGTVCLPWGPFSFELALQREKNVRVALSSAPSLLSGTYNSDAVEFRVRGFRWFDQKWQATVLSMDLEAKTRYYPEEMSDGGLELTIGMSAYRHTWYEKGFLGGDRELDVFVFSREGLSADDGSNINSSALQLSPVVVKGFTLPNEVYWDGSVALAIGAITDSTGVVPGSQEPSEVLEDLLYFGVDLQLMKGDASRQGYLGYTRRLLPSSSVRVLSENRLRMTGQLVRKRDTASLTGYGALTKEEIRLEGTEPFSTSLSYGVEGNYGRFISGPFYLQLTTTAAQSYYSSKDRSRLDKPAFEFRAMASVMASLGSED